MDSQKSNNNEEKTYKVKLAFVGDSGVGKTCIIKRYIQNTFSDQTQTNLGEYADKILNIGKTKINLNIWDTAGQEKFRSFGKLFYKDAYIICLVYDITCKKSFENLKNIWYQDVKQNGEAFTVLAIVGNKADCFLEEQVKEKEAREFASKEKAFFTITSAKTGDGVDKLFENVCKMYLDPDFLNKINDINSDRLRASFKIVKQEKRPKGWCCLLP